MNEKISLEHRISREFFKIQQLFKSAFSQYSAALELKDFFFTLPLALIHDHSKKIKEDVTLEDLKKNPFFFFNMLGGFIKVEKNETDRLVPRIHILLHHLGITDDDLSDLIEEFEYKNDALSLTQVFLLIYIHEVFHVLFKHYSFLLQKRIEAAILKVDKEKAEALIEDKQQLHDFLNMTYDFFVNGVIIDNTGHTFEVIQKEKEKPIFYSEKFKNMSVIEIAAYLIEHMKMNSVKTTINVFGDNGSSQKQPSGNQSNQQNNQQDDQQDNQQKNQQDNQQDSQQPSQKQPGGVEVVKKEFEVDVNGEKFKVTNYEIHVNESDLNEGQDNNDYKDIGDELEQALESARSEMVKKLKGTGSEQFLKDLGIPIEVSVDWLNILEGPLFTVVKHLTDKASISWRRLKSKYRRFAKLPTTIYFENELVVIVSIDQSGSMSDTDLRKINFVINKLAARAKEVIILIHDFDLVKDIRVKGLRLSKDLQAFLSKRYSAGGTSHKDVFDFIEETIPKKTKNEYIYLCFSDMYSDIEDYIPKYNWPKKVNSYFIITRDGQALDKDLSKYFRSFRQLNMETGHFL